MIKISSLRKAHLTPLKSKSRRCANSFNKIQTPFLPTPIRLKFYRLYRRCKYYDQKFYHRQLYIKSPATAASSLPQQQAPQSRPHRLRPLATKAACKAQRPHCCATTADPQ
nr:hypothetical protein [uncultured Campylobacter sp.]